MKNKNLIIYAFLIIVIVLCLYTLLSRPNIGYVDNVKLFEEFQLKKELTRDLEKFELEKKAKLDSLQLELRSLSIQLDTMNMSEQQKMAVFNNKRSIIIAQQQALESRNQDLIDGYDAQISDRLSEYIKDFAEENDIDLLIGTTGNGTIMHGANKFDYTSAASKYINEHYSKQ